MADELVELAYEEAREALREQDRTLSNLRNRAGTLLAAVAVVTSLAATVGLLNADPARGQVLSVWAGWAILGLLMLTAVSVLFTLWPSPEWSFGPSPKKLLEQVGVDVDKVLVAATEAMILAIASNERVLTARANGYRASVLLVLGEVALMVVCLLLYGG